MIALKPEGGNVTMFDFNGSKFNRRGVLKSSMAMLAGGMLGRYGMEKAAAQAEPVSYTHLQGDGTAGMRDRH